VKRRTFLQGPAAGFAAAGLTPQQRLRASSPPRPSGLAPALPFQGVSSGLRITGVRVVDPKPASPENFWAWLQDTIIANPMSIYPKYKQQRSSWRSDKMRAAVWVEITTDKGITGYGKTEGGGAARYIVEEHFARLLDNEDPFDVERLWDVMFRSSLPYGRKGVAVMAISAVDLALWDIIGKAHNQPVYKVLGGKTKEKIPAYATGNDVENYLKFGYHGVKLAVPYGPADGVEGMKRNEELVRQSRRVMGPDLMLMLDCYMAWDVPYTIAMARRLEPYNVHWIEESLIPDDYRGYGRITREIDSTLIATGEHEYTRWGFQLLLDHDGADVLQPDINWCGGLTEIRRIAAMAAGRDLPVIPHQGGTVWGLHFLMATPNAPLAESIGPSQRIDEERQSFIRAVTPLPDATGHVVPSDRPGFGLDLTPYLA
jgi:L-rhamnonate dehydratase